MAKHPVGRTPAQEIGKGALAIPVQTLLIQAVLLMSAMGKSLVKVNLAFPG